jgi:16S rRNA (guanine1207-N2)-methyltransferase
MNDLASIWLINQISAPKAVHSIWFSDENILQSIPTLAASDNKPQLISNRWDVAQRAQAGGLIAQFSDFDCSDIEDNSQDSVFYRISKEKPVVHHIINQSLRILKPGGELIICGQKNEGIKTFIEKAGALFESEQNAKKNGANYSAQLRKNSVYQVKSLLDTSLDGLLDDSNYAQLRLLAKIDNSLPHQLEIYTKPGLFGWNKIDQGSALLIAQFKALLPELQPAPQGFLDLGCGYGYLSLMTADIPFERRVLTDNNAAAIIAAQHNCKTNNISAEVIAADAGENIEPGFDLILCNPPFHQGFSVDGDLTDKFLTSSKQLLAKGGTALFVVNQFIPLERKAQGLFRNIDLVAQVQGFKVVRLGN